MNPTPLIIRVPPRLSAANIVNALNQMALPFEVNSRSADVTLDLGGLEFVDPAATVALGGFVGHFRRVAKRRVTLVGWDPASYLARVELKTLAGYEDDYNRRRHAGDHLTSIIEVADARERGAARAKVLEVLGIEHNGARLVLDYCLEEILRNVEDHADSPVNALLQAQYYEQRRQVVLAVADTGHGILWNMRQRHPDLDDDESALRASLQPGVSGRNVRKGTNAGLGLTVTSRLITRMGGTFHLASGDTLIELGNGGTVVRRLTGARWPGVLVTMTVPRDDRLDWEGTFTEVMAAL